MKIWLPAIRGGSGNDIFTVHLGEALQRRGVDAAITWFGGRYQFFPFLLRQVRPPPGTTIIHATSWNAFAFKRGTTPLLVTEQLGVIDPHARAHKNLPQLIYHETLIRQFVKTSFRSASQITAVSHFTASGLQRSLGISSSKVIYNWVNTKIFSPSPERETSTKRPFRLLFVGNPIQRKGADLLAPIMRALGNTFELYFTAGLRNLKLGGTAPNMFALGRITNVDDLVKIYRNSDALLFPSRFEGLPQAVLEAMACSRPVIAADTSSLPEIIENGINGILCPPDSVDSFVQACRKLAADPKTRRDLGVAARERIKKLFCEDVVVPQYVALYRELSGV